MGTETAYLTVAEMAERFRCSRQTVRRRARSGLLPGIRLDNRPGMEQFTRWIFPLREVERLEREMLRARERRAA